MAADAETLETARAFVTAAELGGWERMRELATEEFLAHGADVRPDVKELVAAFGGFEQAAPTLAAQFRPDDVQAGLEGFVDGRRDRYETFEPVDVRFENVAVESDGMVVVQLEKVERHVGMYSGLEPTGDELSYQVLGVVRVADGLVAEYWNTWDRIESFDDLGIVPGGPIQVEVSEQFDGVVSRVLRHNLRNELSSVTNAAALLEAGEGDTEALAATVQESVRVLQRTADKIRTVEQRVLDPDDPREVDLGAVVREVVDEQRAASPGAVLETETPAEPLLVSTVESVLRLVVGEAVENAAEHGDAPVTVTVQAGGGDGEFAGVWTVDEEAAVATITVRDDGPGIPAQEIDPLERRRETALEHASGIGLWAIKWGAMQLGGGVDFETRTPSGSAVRVWLPEYRPEADPT